MLNTVEREVVLMLTAWLVLGTMLYSLQLNAGSYPKPLTQEEERQYLARARDGDLEEIGRASCRERV